MGIRLCALVQKTEDVPRVKHFQGLPPELTGGQDYREKLPWPQVLVIEEKPDGAFLFRFATDGSSGGDTWHTSIDDAKYQAEYEYQGLLSEWKQVPTNVTDVIVFALSQNL